MLINFAAFLPDWTDFARRPSCHVGLHRYSGCSGIHNMNLPVLDLSLVSWEVPIQWYRWYHRVWFVRYVSYIKDSALVPIDSNMQ